MCFSYSMVGQKVRIPNEDQLICVLFTTIKIIAMDQLKNNESTRER